MSTVRILTNDDGQGLWENIADAQAFVDDGGSLHVREELSAELIVAFSPMGWFRVETEG